MTIHYPYEAKFSDPGVYQIRVSGKVRNELKDYFEGIEISVVVEPLVGKKETLIIVNIRDQSELMGLINILYNWQHDLISVHLEKVSIS